MGVGVGMRVYGCVWGRGGRKRPLLPSPPNLLLRMHCPAGRQRGAWVSGGPSHTNSTCATRLPLNIP